MDIYRETIIDHYKHPRNYGRLKHPQSTKKAANATCGDSLIMDIQVSKDKKVITDIKYSGIGCVISIASASLLTEYVKGKNIDQIIKIKPEDIYSMLGTKLTPSRTKCALLSLEVLHLAINSLQTKI